MAAGIVGHLVETLAIKWMRRGEMESRWLRQHFRKHYDIEVGNYSYGCFDQWRISGHTRIGRYCSFAKTVRIIDANHPFDSLSTHPFMYAKEVGAATDPRMVPRNCIVEDDVWLSHNVTITPGCKFVGRGAIVGAGAVVTKDVPRYAMVAGIPGRIVKQRFPPDVADAIEETQWWTLDKPNLLGALQSHPKAFHHPTVESLRELTDWLAERLSKHVQ